MCQRQNKPTTSAMTLSAAQSLLKMRRNQWGTSRSKWYDGVVDVVHADGTCRIRFDDGDIYEHVKPQYITAAEVSVSPEPSNAKLEQHDRTYVEVDALDTPVSAAAAEACLWHTEVQAHRPTVSACRGNILGAEK